MGRMNDMTANFEVVEQQQGKPCFVELCQAFP
jgi:hypothetical protein